MADRIAELLLHEWDGDDPECKHCLHEDGAGAVLGDECHVRLRTALDAATAQIRADEEGRVAWCRECGRVSSCDEDRCCSTCGYDLLVLADLWSAEVLEALMAERQEALDAATRERDEARRLFDSLDQSWVEERGAIVRWLRDEYDNADPEGPAVTVLRLADAIERGEHTKEGT